MSKPSGTLDPKSLLLESDGTAHNASRGRHYTNPGALSSPRLIEKLNSSGNSKTWHGDKEQSRISLANGRTPSSDLISNTQFRESTFVRKSGDECKGGKRLAEDGFYYSDAKVICTNCGGSHCIEFDAVTVERVLELHRKDYGHCIIFTKCKESTSNGLSVKTSTPQHQQSREKEADVLPKQVLGEEVETGVELPQDDSADADEGPPEAEFQAVVGLPEGEVPDAVEVHGDEVHVAVDLYEGEVSVFCVCFMSQVLTALCRLFGHVTGGRLACYWWM